MRIHFKNQRCCILQVVGFVVLVSGTSLYNELIRSCLPTVYESTVDSDLEVGRLGRIILSPLQSGGSYSCHIAGVRVGCFRNGAASITSHSFVSLPSWLLPFKGLNESACCRPAVMPSCKYGRRYRVNMCSLLMCSLQDALLAAAPEDSGLAAGPQDALPGDGVRPSLGRNIRMMAKPRSISGSLYTMARSMRLFPTALSPHR